MVGVDSVQADSQPKSSGLVLGRLALGAVLHSSNESGELSQWLCYDDSTINIVLDIIIIIIINIAQQKLLLCSLKILPFLALGLGMDDMFLITHEFSLLADKPNIDRHVSKIFLSVSHISC